MKNRKAFVCGISSKKLTNQEKLFLKKHKPWGIILFSRNLDSFEQIKELTHSIKKIFKDQNYPILIDQEGGRINRLNKLIETSFFSSEFFGNLYKENKIKFSLYYKVYISQIAYLLTELGININTVPVLDVRRKKSSKVIGNRSYSSSPQNVSNLGNFCINEFTKYNIGTVIKHIPGHGLAKVDSHKKTPVVKKKIKFLIKNDFLPFMKKKSFFAMTSHVVFADIDPKNTATHSVKIIKLIRKKLGFKNIIISDDISMKGLKYSIKLNILKALSAGCNLILHCNGRLSEMKIVAENSPLVDKFIIKKTAQFYEFIR